MNDARDNYGIAETGLPLLRELIHERIGLCYDNGRANTLNERLAPLVLSRGFRSFLDLYYLLKYDEAEAEPEWRRVADALAVPETYFWREMDQIEALVSRLVPELVQQHPGRTIRIWSVPCATGEEPLTIAMALTEAGWFDRASIEIRASDASEAAIAKARAATYRDRSFRTLPPELKDKYFIEGPDGCRPVCSLSSRISSWSVVNLLTPGHVAAHAGTPIVFCRNAFIYFSPQTIRRVVDLLADAMPTPGYLFLGASESLLRITDRFSLEQIDRAFMYVKR
jgi:chemotaxis protein methyltransferase CheR